MNAQHTPTPWQIQDWSSWVVCSDGTNFLKIVSPWKEDVWIGDEEAAANMAHIVKCVNAHDALVAALKNITAVAGNLPDELLTMRTGPNDAAARGLMVVSAREIARAALSAAGESP